MPFSVTGGRALVEGTGETVTPLDFEPREFLLVLPPFGVDTAKVYAAWDERWDGQERPATPGVNALTAAALTVEPRLARWRDALGDVDRRGADVGRQRIHLVRRGRASRAPDEDLRWLTQGDERARLIRAHTVPAGWDGS